MASSRSRIDHKGKQRKVNRLYNILITAVILLIIIVGTSIFMGKEDSAAENSENKTASVNVDKNQAGNQDENAEEVSLEEKGQTEDEQASVPSDENESEETDGDTAEGEDTDGTQTGEAAGEIVEHEETDDPNITKSYSNDAWEPVGTTQKGKHPAATFEKGSADWQEMERAVAYGAGLDPGNMTVWFLGNGGSPNTAVGTVSPKDNSGTYRVHIQWVDGQGWKPVKVQELKSNDRQ
ncbi:DUF1510 family protein [Peribacillus saganii]|uniref:DUF1510 family protein n=1 Tax=Peribacillus saganii TaxID=2303992 RepID=A0A372LUP3_9BACI|nr:YrrS family protein [Peribacillus saganii]RFU71637.1 DUF1510 family protein [Peribacillus saganii]